MINLGYLLEEDRVQMNILLDEYFDKESEVELIKSADEQYEDPNLHTLMEICISFFEKHKQDIISSEEKIIYF